MTPNHPQTPLPTPSLPVTRLTSEGNPILEIRWKPSDGGRICLRVAVTQYIYTGNKFVFMWQPFSENMTYDYILQHSQGRWYGLLNNFRKQYRIKQAIQRAYMMVIYCYIWIVFAHQMALVISALQANMIPFLQKSPCLQCSTSIYRMSILFLFTLAEHCRCSRHPSVS